MNGKQVKVKEYNLEFGTKDRFVNIIGCFKYKPSSNIYVIYTDIDTKYNIIYYGNSHLKENIVLCMDCRDKTEEEIIKEYIYKITSKEPLDNFEILSLENIENIEIINSSKLEVKEEILTNIIDITIPKKEQPEEKVIIKPTTTKQTKNKSPILTIILIILIIITISYYFFVKNYKPDIPEKNILCTKSYQHSELTANIEETNQYNFNVNDTLVNIDTTILYQFDELKYQDFIFKGTYFKYMPQKNQKGNWEKNDEEYTFKVMTKEIVDTSYNKPTNYEEVLSYYKKAGYTCTESLTNE